MNNGTVRNKRCELLDSIFGNLVLVQPVVFLTKLADKVQTFTGLSVV